MSLRIIVSFIALLAIPCTQSLAEQTACTPGELRTDSTPSCVSIEWDVSGDSDHDATCGVQYREEASDDWKPALPLFRVDYQWWYHTQRAERPFNMFAGSILFLKPGTRYEVRLNLVDPDGGKVTKHVTVATRSIPALPAGGRTLHVASGNGGGSGSADDPFRGLAMAQEAATPGDILLLCGGDYGSFTFEKPGEPDKYIVWKAAGDGDAVFESIRIGASHLWLEGLTLKRQKESNGLRALTSMSRNNLYISADGSAPVWVAYDCRQPQYCLPNNYEPTWMTDVDYDGFDWGDAQHAFRWNNNRRYNDLQSFAEAVGIETLCRLTRSRRRRPFVGVNVTCSKRPSPPASG